MIHNKFRYILTLVALFAMTAGAWAQTGENIFQYCYDCQRSPAYPKTTASASLSGFANPYVGYNGIGRYIDNTSDGPWKLEYMGIWSTTDKHGIDDVSNYQSTYNCTDVPVFRLYQWNATANEYQHAAYGVVCAYAKVSNAIEHTAMFEAEGGWGCVLTNSSHSSSMNITFDEDLTTGLTTLIAAATPNASSPITVEWDAATKTGTFSMPGSDVVLTPIYAKAAAFATTGSGSEVTTLLPAPAEGVVAGTAASLIAEGTGIVAFAGTSTEVTQGQLMYAIGTSATEAPALTAFSATVPTAENVGDDGGNVYVWYYIQGADAPVGVAATLDNTFENTEPACLTVTVLSNKFDITLNPANANTIDATQASKGTVTVKTGDAAAVDKTADIDADHKLKAVKMGSKVTITTKDGYKFRKVEAKKTGSAVLAPALENGATVVIICNWGYATTTFTYTNNGGTFSGQASGYEANYFYNGLELNGKNLSFGASNVDLPDLLSVGITFNTESSAYSYTGKGEDFVSFTISVNGTDVTDQLSELK